jgi:hypothetical protein
MLAEELAKCVHRPEIFITHLKPSEIDLTMQEISQCASAWKPRMLQNNQILEF